MPYANQTKGLLIPEKHDKRRKLSTEQWAEIQHKKTNGATIPQLAREYNVCESTIKYVVYEERRKYCSEYRKANWRRHALRGEEWNKVVREHRAHRKELHDKGLLIDPTN